MEIKAILQKPYTDTERMDFIVSNNHNLGYVIEETDTELQAWDKTEEEKQQEETERVANLYMTRSDFFDNIIMAFGLEQKELRVIIEQILNKTDITNIEIKIALNNYDNALNFYRKHTLFTLLNKVEIPISDTMTLLFTDDIWDKFFDTKNYKELQKAIKK